MQKILLLLAFVCLALPALNAQNARRVEVFFQHSYTITDLNNIKAELGAQKILVDYTHMKFDDAGQLVELEFQVNCQDGFEGSAGSTKIPSDRSFGFVRDFRPDAEVPFSVGNIGMDK